MKTTRLILCRSQSEAMILSKKLSACGISSRMRKPPQSETVKSCAWAIEVAARDSERIETCFHEIAPDVWKWEDTDDLS